MHGCCSVRRQHSWWWRASRSNKGGPWLRRRRLRWPVCRRFNRRWQAWCSTCLVAKPVLSPFGGGLLCSERALRLLCPSPALLVVARSAQQQSPLLPASPGQPLPSPSSVQPMVACLAQLLLLLWAVTARKSPGAPWLIPVAIPGEAAYCSAGVAGSCCEGRTSRGGCTLL